MIASLAPCFAGSLSWYGNAVSLPGEHARAISGRELLDGDVADRLIESFAATYPGADRRALVSMWTQWHFGALVIPTTAAAVVLDRDLPVDLEQVGIALHEDGRTAAMIVADEGKPHGAGATDRFSRLFNGHIEPLIRRYAHQFDVSQRLLWINAAAIFEWTLQQASEGAEVNSAGLGEGRALLESRTDRQGRPNPLFGAVRYPVENGEPVRRRKVCCLRYLLPGVADCGCLCPLPEMRAERRPAQPPKPSRAAG